MAKSNALSWADLFSQGSLIDLDISVWAALVRVKPSDLGIENTDSIQKALSFGHERLIAKAKLDPIRELEGEARRKCEQYSIPFKLIPGASFISKAKRKTLEKELGQIREKFISAVGRFVREYETNRETQLPIIKKALTDGAKDPKAVDAAMDRIISLYPTKEKIQELFAMRWKLFSIAAPMDGSGDSAEANSVREAVDGMITKLREEIEARTQDIIKLVARGGKLTAKTFNSSKALLNRLESLNIFGDPGLAAIIAKLREILNAAQNSNNAGEVLTLGLKPIAEELAASKAKALEEVADRLTGKAHRKLIA